MVDPYKILGVPHNANEEQIKIAYRELAKKYHPDNYDKSPLADLAAEKMKEVNEAYDQIMNERKNGKKSPGGNRWSSAQGYRSSGGSYQDVRNLITQNRFADAEQILDGVPVPSRNAEWYFLKGSLLYRKGWIEDAYRHFESACRMDPSNPEYAAALNQMLSQRSSNFMNYNAPGGSMGCSFCDMCASFMCADMCCSCLGPRC